MINIHVLLSTGQTVWITTATGSPLIPVEGDFLAVPAENALFPMYRYAKVRQRVVMYRDTSTEVHLFVQPFETLPKT